MSAGNANWEEVIKGRRVCSVSGRAFSEGDHYYSAVQETDNGFVRTDYAPEVWETLEKSEFVSYWHGKVPSENERKKNRLIIDTEAFYQFFLGLLPDTSANRAIFRYLLALILVRKRVLRLDEIEKSPDGEALILFDTRAKTEYHIPVPAAGKDELNAAQEELNQLLT